MQIHDLNTGTPAATDVLAMDTGSDTYKTTPGNVVPDYTSGDSSTATSWTSVTAVASGLSFSTLIGRITTMMKNVRYLYTILGSSTFSTVASTITGAIGNTALGTTATTLSGAIAEHEGDISTLNSKFIRSSSMQAVSAYQSRVDNLYGGYIKIGSLVFVSMIARATTTLTAGAGIVSGFPVPYNTNLPLSGIVHSTFTDLPVFINSSGILCGGPIDTGRYFTVSGVYVCAD